MIRKKFSNCSELNFGHERSLESAEKSDKKTEEESEKEELEECGESADATGVLGQLGKLNEEAENLRGVDRRRDPGVMIQFETKIFNKLSKILV